MPYRDWLPTQAPGWLRGRFGARYLDAGAWAFDALKEASKAAVQSAWPRTAPSDALPSIGVDRAMPRFPAELEASYRERLHAAWPSWPRAGTEEGLLAVLRAAGFTDAALYSARGSAPSWWEGSWPPKGDATANWSRFWVELTANPFAWAAARRTPYGAVTRLRGHTRTRGSTATAGEVAFVRALVAQWKPAHAIHVATFVRLPVTAPFVGTVTLTWPGA